MLTSESFSLSLITSPSTLAYKSDPLDTMDLQSLPSLMSPDHSTKDLSESVDGREEEDEDEDMLDEYEAMTLSDEHRSSLAYHLDRDKPRTPLQLLRPERRVVPENPFPSPPSQLPPSFPLPQHQQQSEFYNQFQQQHFSHLLTPQYQQMAYSTHFPFEPLMAPSTAVETLYPHLYQNYPLQPSTFLLDPLAPQQQLNGSTPISFYPSFAHNPASTPDSAHSTPALLPLPQPAQDTFEALAASFGGLPPPAHTNTMDYYLASMATHHAPSTDKTTPSLADLTPSTSTTSMPMLTMVSSTAELVQSPTLSWASLTPSRDGSPSLCEDLSPAIVLTAPSGSTAGFMRSTTRPHSSKKRSGSTFSRSNTRNIKVSRKMSTTAGVSDPIHTNPSLGPLSIPTVPTLSPLHTAVEPATAAATPPKRRRRMRQVKVKVKPTQFSCDVHNCGKIFSRAYNLTSHMKTHSDEKPFLCGVGSCVLAFARRHDRERHVRLHTGEKPYRCDSCGCGFMRNDALHRHQRICGQSAVALMALLHQQQQHQHQQHQHLPVALNLKVEEDEKKYFDGQEKEDEEDEEDEEDDDEDVDDDHSDDEAQSMSSSDAALQYFAM